MLRTRPKLVKDGPPMRRLPTLAALVALALCGGCSSGSRSGTPEHLVADLSFEIRYQATVEIDRDGSNLDVALTPRTGFDLLESGKRYEGIGVLEDFPEAHTRLYTAGFDAPAIRGGPCGSRPITLALSLSRRDDRPDLSGSLAAYCGAKTYTGTPARIFRLAGKLRSD